MSSSPGDEDRARRLERWRLVARARRAAGHALIAAATGSGLAAGAATAGGADLVMVYSSSRFRTAGLGSLAALMPYANANDLVFELGREVIDAAGGVPVIAGVCATDPLVTVNDTLERVARMGFAGVQNFPTVALVDGRLRRDLEATGISFEREVEMIRVARRLSLLACAFVVDQDEARAMALAGADVLAVHVGVTRAGEARDAELAEVARHVEQIAQVGRGLRDDLFVLCHGGPIVEPRDVQTVLALAESIDGYIGASMVERTPVAEAITERVRELTAVRASGASSEHTEARLPNASELFAAPAPPPKIELTVDNLAAYLETRGVIEHGDRVEVDELGGGVSNVLLCYRTEFSCGVIKQSRRRIRVVTEWLCDNRRVLNERDAIAVLATRLPVGTIPSIQFSDDDNYVFAMDCAPPEARLWKSELMQGVVDLRLARRCGELLHILHETTRDDHDLRRRFDNEPLLDELRLDPWYAHTARAHPECAEAIHEAASRLRTVKEVLVHGDYVPKNMFRTPAGLLVLDWEIVHFGNAGYDIAQLICHLLLKAHRPGAAWSDYEAAIQAFSMAYSVGLTPRRTAAVEDEAMLQLGCLLLARVDGKSPVEYLNEDARDHVRRLGRRILRERPARLEAVLSTARRAVATSEARSSGTAAELV
jgi:predicted TIM-barrel enzyme